MTKCAVCDITVSSEEQYAEHVKGKRHKRQVEIYQHREEEARRSLFVPLNEKTGSNKKLIRKVFEQYGAVSRVVVDPNKAAFAIVEFQDPGPVSELLTAGKHVVCDDIKFKYLPRKVQLKPAGKKETADPTARKANTGTPASAAKPRRVNPTRPEPLEKETIRGTLLAVPREFPPLAYIPPDAALPRSREHLAKLGQQLQNVVGHLKPKPDVKGTHERVLTELDAVVRSCAPEGHPGVDRKRQFVVPVGSLVTGLAREGSDADVSVSAPWLTGVTGLQELAAALRAAQHFGQVLCLPEARCPIIKAVHLTTTTHLEISLHNRLAERNTELVEHYMQLWPGFRTLVRAACIWFRAIDVPWSSYLITLLTIRYMQVKHGVPSLQKMASDSVEPKDDSAPACAQCAKEWALRVGEDDSHSNKRTKAQLGDVEAFVAIHEHDCMFCPHQEPSHFGLDVTSDLALLANLFLDFLDFCIAWMTVHSDIVMDIKPDGQTLSPATREHYLTNDSAIGGAAGLVFVDPFERTHNIARNVTAKHCRVVAAGVCWLFDEWLRKCGRRFSFHTHCMYADKIMEAVHVFCHEFEFNCRPPNPGEGVEQGVRGPLDDHETFAGMLFVLEASEVTWVNRRRRRRQRQQQPQQHGSQQDQQPQQQQAQGDRAMDTSGTGAPILQALLRVQRPYVAVDCIHAPADEATGFETWAALFKKEMLAATKQGNTGSKPGPGAGNNAPKATPVGQVKAATTTTTAPSNAMEH